MSVLGPKHHQADSCFRTIATECEGLKIDRRSIPEAAIRDWQSATQIHAFREVEPLAN
jgi:hypothetical protein